MTTQTTTRKPTFDFDDVEAGGERPIGWRKLQAPVHFTNHLRELGALISSNVHVSDGEHAAYWTSVQAAFEKFFDVAEVEMWERNVGAPRPH